MSALTFRALVVDETPDHGFERSVKTRTVADLPEGEVLIKVQYSSLNYKDTLSASGNKGVTRSYPHTPGIDAAGEVVHSTVPAFAPDQSVIVTGYDLGMNTPGGFGQYIRVPSDWIVPLPDGLTLKESMILGTAGFTAGLSLFKMEQAGLSPQTGEILVTGASGGLGSLAVALLAHRGYTVTAASGKPEASDLLNRLGAYRIIARKELSALGDKALLPKRWAGVIDTVGGEILSSAIRSTQPDGVIASCGNAASAELHLTVFPFIIRGVSLVGIDSATCPMSIRRQIWQRLAGVWKPADLELLCSEIGLDDLEGPIQRMLQGGLIGRRVVAL